jgi:hypothetical protein
MDENNKKEQLPDHFPTFGYVLKAARQGMGIRAIAARFGTNLTGFRAFLAAHPEAELAFENARADYEESKRKRIDLAEQKAEAKDDWSLVYKINREAIKELNEQDATVRVQLVQPEDNAIPEVEYEDLSAEELAAIREATERADRGGSDE